MPTFSSDWSLITHLDHGDSGSLSLIKPNGDAVSVTNLTGTISSDKKHSPWFLGMTDNAQVILFDPVSKELFYSDTMPLDAYPAYSYKDPSSSRIWFMNDGDKDTGNDPLNCGDQGSTVTIIDRPKGQKPKHIATLCVGRGHHVTTFITPTDEHPNNPTFAFVSNLVDGTISVINNDDTDKNNFLSIVGLIDLTEADKEKEGLNQAPNNAFPHGTQYSNVTGKIYSLNNGYGTVAVINPITQSIESCIALKGSSNLLLSPCQRFIIGKGADRKSNPKHVVGKISVIDLVKQEVVVEQDINDFYPSVYRFGPDGEKLFVTSAATGKGEQKDNLKINTLYIYDAKQLPDLVLLKIIEVGSADCGRRPIAFPTDPACHLAFIPNPSEGTLSLVNTASLEVTN